MSLNEPADPVFYGSSDYENKFMRTIDMCLRLMPKIILHEAVADIASMPLQVRKLPEWKPVPTNAP